jgi:hypothetical protein
MAELGNFEVVVSGAVVKTASFFNTDVHKTSEEEWDLLRKDGGVAPWSDFETNTFLMQVPTPWLHGYTFAELSELAATWQTAMNGLCEYGGYPTERSHKAMYLQPDVHIKHGAHGIGYPQVNVVYNPNTIASESGRSSNWMVTDPMKSDIEWHETGHAQSATMYRGESEAICNFPKAYVENVKFGVDFDVAFQQSFGPDYGNVGYQPDDAAIHWMITSNFKDGLEMETANTEDNQIRYQQRGYAKYADIARTFGWQAWRDFHITLNQVANKVRGLTNYLPEGVDPDTTVGDGLGATDKRTLLLSMAAGADLTALIHFWGIHPENAVLLAEHMANHSLPAPYTTILPLLVRYVDLIPANNAAFLEHFDRVYPGMPSGGNPKYGHGWYNEWKDVWGESNATDAQVALEQLLSHYFPDVGCTVRVF